MPTIEKDVAVGQHLLQRMLEARRRSDALFALVKTDAIYDRPIPERHRIIFYVGHLEAFDWNLLHERALGMKSFQRRVGSAVCLWHRSCRRRSCPAINRQTGLPSTSCASMSAGSGRRWTRKLSTAAPAGAGSARDGFPLATLLNVAIEHRLMHLETLVVHVSSAAARSQNPPGIFRSLAYFSAGIPDDFHSCRNRHSRIGAAIQMNSGGTTNSKATPSTCLRLRSTNTWSQTHSFSIL